MIEQGTATPSQTTATTVAQPLINFGQEYTGPISTGLIQFPKLFVNPFDPTKDYYAELAADEKYVVNNNEYPLLKGLQRLGHTYRGGIKSYIPRIICTPRRDNPIASVEVTIIFNDGTQFGGVADATPAAHEKPFSLHLVAVAESKAASRALRQAFNISKATREEIGSPPVAVEEEEDEPINDAQQNALNNIAKRKGLDEKQLLALLKTKKVSIASLTKDEGRRLMKALNKQ